MESYYLMNIKYQLGMMKKFWTWIMVMISQQCECTWHHQSVHFRMVKMRNFILLCILPNKKSTDSRSKTKLHYFDFLPFSYFSVTPSANSGDYTFKICTKSTISYHHHYHFCPYNLPLPLGNPSLPATPIPCPYLWRRTGLANSGEGEADLHS